MGAVDYPAVDVPAALQAALACIGDHRLLWPELKRAKEKKALMYGLPDVSPTNREYRRPGRSATLSSSSSSECSCQEPYMHVKTAHDVVLTRDIDVTEWEQREDACRVEVEHVPVSITSSQLFNYLTRTYLFMTPVWTEIRSNDGRYIGTKALYFPSLCEREQKAGGFTWRAMRIVEFCEFPKVYVSPFAKKFEDLINENADSRLPEGQEWYPTVLSYAPECLGAPSPDVVLQEVRRDARLSHKELWEDPDVVPRFSR